jgi:hypothetical protein
LRSTCVIAMICSSIRTRSSISMPCATKAETAPHSGHGKDLPTAPS